MNSKMSPARVDREDERRMLPCRNFLDGFCPRGPRCRFYHPPMSSISTVIRVPNLPSSFQQNNFGQFPVHSGPHSVFSLSPSQSSRSHMAISPKIGGIGTPASGRFLGLNGFGNNFARSVTAPMASPTYSEYELACTQQEIELRKERERRATASAQVPSAYDEPVQNTVFNHINWKEFLTPGAMPPPPTHVPFMSDSPRRATEAVDSLESLLGPDTTENSKIASAEDLPKTNSFVEQVMMEHELQAEALSEEKMPSPPEIKVFVPQAKLSRPLSAKEELQMKVKQIAKELAAEPAQHVKSLDTFFRNYTFQTIPTAPPSEQDLVGPASSASCEIKEAVINNSAEPEITSSSEF